LLRWSKKVLDTIPEEELQKSFETTYKILDMRQALQVDFESAFVLHPKRGYSGYLIRRDGKISFLDEEKAQTVLESWFNSIGE
jgi:hypothetical protein